MLSVAVVKPNQVELIDIPLPIPGPYEARIRNEAVCLCNATDRKLIEGHFPGVEDYPLILGHETVGIVDAVGEKVRNFQVGERIIGGLLLNSTNPTYASGWGGFSEYILAGDHHAMVADGVANSENNWFEVYEIMRVVPASIPVEDAVMLCTWREVYGAFGDFQLKEGDDILVFGAGPVGLSFVKFARLLDLGFICVVEILPEKRQKAIEMGADAALAPDETGLSALVDQRQKSFDAVIDAVGKEAIINSALPLIKMAGSVCVYGVIDTPIVNLQKGIGPYNFNLFVHQWPTRFREAAAQEPLCEWIEAGKLSHREFISVEYPITQINQAIELSKSGQTIKTLLRF
jgi:threonine dehydrogenase-like Zn-dependent dehydrogenase